ncbi:hypothetical protein JB92DRAFT_681139 [Gautieria morchelliformis]|nr:hypothetical protein JB92DRAFT_681139 [Gautieria morchelliformis]
MLGTLGIPKRLPVFITALSFLSPSLRSIYIYTAFNTTADILETRVLHAEYSWIEQSNFSRQQIKEIRGNTHSAGEQRSEWLFLAFVFKAITLFLSNLHPHNVRGTLRSPGGPSRNS